MYCLEDVSFVEVYKLTYDTAKLIYNEEDSELQYQALCTEC